MTTNIKSLLAVVLVGLLLLSACEEKRALGIRYNAERLMYQAEREFREGVIGDADLSALVRSSAQSYRHAMDYCRLMMDSIDQRSATNEYLQVTFLAYQATSRLSQLHYSARHYDTCVALLSDLLTSVPLYGSHQLTTTLSLGRSLQSAGNWDSAVVLYDYALERFYPPVDDSGRVQRQLLELPLHMWEVSHQTGSEAEQVAQLGVAEHYYATLAEDDPKSEVSRAARAILARLYAGTGRVELAVETLRSLLDPKDASFITLQTRIADLQASKLKRYDTALALYRNALDNLTPADSLYRPLLLFKTARSLLAQGEYEDAREILIDVKRNYEFFFSATPQAQQAMARSFELQGKWSRAETEYKFLIEFYRGSDEAMATFLYLADHYERIGRPDAAAQWLAEAGQYYEKLAARGSGTITEARALIFQADLAFRKNDLRKAGLKLEALYNNFPDTHQGKQALLKAAALYRNQLADTAKADSLISILRTAMTQQDVWEN